MTGTTAPRSRPRERRAAIVAEGTALFAERGYAEVTMAALADAVGITAGALYRHFPGKAELLAQVLTASADRIGVGGEGPSDLEDLLRVRAEAAVDDGVLGRLWLTDARWLPADDRATMTARLAREEQRIAAALRRRRPTVAGTDAAALSAMILPVLLSPTGHLRGLPRGVHVEQLVEAGLAVAGLDLAPPIDEEPQGELPVLRPRSRRERLLAAAGETFGAQGYEATSMADIGAAAGVTGPSLYSHVSGKEELLRLVLERGEHALWTDLDDVLATTRDEAQALGRVVRSYVARGHLQPYVVTLVVEGRHLAVVPRERQLDYLREWIGLLRGARPALGEPEATARVQAAVNMVNHRVFHPSPTVDTDRLAAGATVTLLGGALSAK